LLIFARRIRKSTEKEINHDQSISPFRFFQILSVRQLAPKALGAADVELLLSYLTASGDLGAAPAVRSVESIPTAAGLI
jgi:hypothetical protein